ncbi:hypothetical protein BSAF29S_01408 [Bacillus safensis subsp. safensis]
MSLFDGHKIDVQFSVDLMTGNRTDSIVQEMLSRRIQTLLTSTLYGH